MTIKEAKAIELLTADVSDMVLMCLPENKRKAFNLLTKAVDKKRKNYPNYFKSKACNCQLNY